jgi:hypothetical protein
MILRLLLLAMGMIGTWLVLLYPTVRLGGSDGVLASGCAMLLCLIPACVTLAWRAGVTERSPSERLFRMVLSMGLRYTVVLGGGCGLYLLVPSLNQIGLWLWILVYYLVALALETALLAVPREHPGTWPAQNQTGVNSPASMG